MRFEPVTIKLKNGKEVLIREASIEDAEELIKAAKAYLRTSDYLCSYEDEFDPMMTEEINWIKSHQNANSLLLVATHEDEILATFNATGFQNRKMQHIAVLGISILEECRGQGLGTILFENLINWAKDNPFLEMLVLETFSDNADALKLYEKFGFEIDGVRKNYFKGGTNKYSDNVLMSLNVKIEEI